MTGEQVLEILLDGNRRYLEGAEASGPLGSVIGELTAAVEPVRQQKDRSGDTVSQAIRANAWYTMTRLLKRSDVINGNVQSGDLLL